VFAAADATLAARIAACLAARQPPIRQGAAWTTDAPFRETGAMIETCRQAGILAVEMEAAALYALAEAKQYDIVCFALVTNRMGQSEEDFEKGEVPGSQTLLHIIGQTIRVWEFLRHSGTRPDMIP